MCDHQRDQDAGSPMPPAAAPCREMHDGFASSTGTIQTHNAGVGSSSLPPAIVGQQLTLRSPNSATTGATTAPQNPRFGAAVLRALARVQVTRADIRRDPRSAAFDGAWLAHDTALAALWSALDADANAAHPVPVGDEGERTPMPHRFGSPL